MTIVNNVAAKLSVVFVAVAMLFTLTSPAQAQSAEELQQMINDLLAQVASLQGQIGGGDSGMSASGVCPYTWTRSLNIGASGMDVMKLQQFLNSDADTRIAATGVGSAGQETEFYGGLTGAAVAKFQSKHRNDILAPLGLVNATTYFGPSTMAKANSLCASGGSMGDSMGDSTGDDSSDDDDDSGSGSKSLSGSADLEDFEVDDPSDDDIDEGQEDAQIAELTVRFENGDAEIDRLELGILADGETDTNTVEPWDVFETISLWVDGDKVAEMDADDEDDWLDEDAGTIRFTSLGIVAEEDEDVVIDVAATVQNGLDTSPAEIGDWDLVAEEIRFFDADGAHDDDSTTDGLNNFDRSLPFGGDVSTFTIQEEGDEDELFVRSSTNDPDSTTIELEDDETSDWITIFVFDLDTEDSTNDIDMESLQVDLSATEDGTTATSTVNLIDDMQLVVDGESYDDVTITHGTTGTFVFDLDDEDWTIEAGDRVEVEVQVEFEALTSTFEGATVEADVDSANISAEGPENLTGSQLSGSAQGEEHTLRTEGAILSLESTDETLKVNDDQDTTDDEGEFTIEFEVTAFESDLYVNKSALRSTTTFTSDGVNFRLEDGSGNEVTTGTSSASLTSSADEDGTRYRVNEGETETFTLNVEFDPASEGFYQLQLWSLNFNTSNSDPNASQRALDESDYETGSLSI